MRGLFTSPTGSRAGLGRGVGPGWDGAGAVRGPPAFKFGQEGLGPALRGAREFGAGTATLAFPDAGRLGVGAVGGAGPRDGPRPSRHPGGSRTRAGGAGAGLGPAPAARGRHSPSSWSGGGLRAGDVSRGSGGTSRRLKVSGVSLAGARATRAAALSEGSRGDRQNALRG